ncbi:hypothetical protein DIU31_012340 [Mucilaginibacter rubeus]|uniref:Uncharacterized protein n=1 Tax=Mucilaginibacter rubeus TaxID=2027860 RepID=A0AAE6JES4_9SPHI|nr:MULTISPECIES: hypothetical protein [Mucilaginibacter]QEM04258.1 hypothetical protein DIU31_012340 [Mucilaginibacter rubeus]QEM16857.1 hypothetical protein DIU38_012460 [Mucilaginibacter gossypii]QTE46657.1 hypothetical protein J3L19_15270 [Mucilaginibacter rubeus]QTE53254.1 hypothetical protein J3L21_15245 [Mucilaginibacter rubeus]QTE58341.1 hypothetical protein J3L23_06920 [Mucilaginibacter rubeus]
MNASPWFWNTKAALYLPDLIPVYKTTSGSYDFKIYDLGDSCWLVVGWPDGNQIAFRLAYSPNDRLQITLKERKNDVRLKIGSLLGDYEVVLTLPTEDRPVLHHTTRLTPASTLLFPYWPRDIVPLGFGGSKSMAEGQIHTRQVGTRSGQLYFSMNQPKAGSVLYLQNLTALAGYNQQTETSAGDSVGGEWPEIGFALPPTIKNRPLAAGTSYTLSDAFIVFSEEVPADEAAMVRQYLNLLAEVYLALPKPATNYIHWPDILDKGLKDLIDSPGCWVQLDGHHYFNAYVSDYITPPEIMVQLAVLLPLLDYVEWSGAELEVMKKVKAGLPSFYSEKYGTIMRWHPKAADTLEGEEEQKQPLVMDSWYLHHPLLNLSRLALKGDKVARKLFLDSLEFSIRVAHHFNYKWPVFYKVDTLEVVKAETQPGKGGEKDVPGLFAHVMLQAWELTGEKRYLTEAEKAAMHLRGQGFDLFYQANNTAFSAGAMLRLYKITKKEIYRELSYLCLAGVFNNVKLWNCDYGYGKNLPTFFALFPLNDAPYTAVYEEQEVFCALHDYLRYAEDIEILPSVRLLINEYVRYLVDRAAYYYPTMLPKEMLQEKPKIGEVDPNLWIALEDLHDGWEKSGQVGQEVYGAGNAFGILPRHYIRIPDQPFMIFTDYPVYRFATRKQDHLHVRMAGDNRIDCRLMVVKSGHGKLPGVEVRVNQKPIDGKKIKGGHFEYLIPGNAEITISWK